MCIRIGWDRVRNMFATVLTTITTIWRQGFNLNKTTSESNETKAIDSFDGA